MEDGETALEIILSLPKILKKLESKIDILDTNLKILNSKINKIKQDQPIQVQSQVQAQETIEPIAIKEEQKSLEQKTDVVALRPTAKVPDLDMPAPSPKRTEKVLIGNIKVYSTIRTESGKMVPMATVNIFDYENSLVKSIQSDKNGYWECRLPAGKYSLELLVGKLKPINKFFELKKDTKEFEVT